MSNHKNVDNEATAGVSAETSIGDTGLLSKRAAAVERARAAVKSVKLNTGGSEVAVAAAVAREKATASVAAANVAEKTKAAEIAAKRAQQSKQLADAADLDLEKAKKIVDLVAAGKVPVNQSMPKQAKQHLLMSFLPPNMPQTEKKKTAQSLMDINISLESENIESGI